MYNNKAKFLYNNSILNVYKMQVKISEISVKKSNI